MKFIIKTVILSLICVQSLANPFHTLIKEVLYHINNPLEFMKNNDNQDYWFAYSVPAAANTPSNCCWNQEVHQDLKFQSCDLNQEIQSFGYQNDSKTTKNSNIFIHVKDQQISQILPLGDHCNVKADNLAITWLDEIKPIQSINFLKGVALENSKELANNSLFAISLHKHKEASNELYKLAKQKNQEFANEAIFWLAENRQDGLSYLKNLYNELPNSPTKKHINFALSLINNQQAIELLQDITLNDNDKQQRTDALFWLAEIAPAQTKTLIFKLLDNPSENFDSENLIFTLSRLPNGQGDESLFKILSSNYSNPIKKKSLFWLAQSENSETIDKLQRILQP